MLLASRLLTGCVATSLLALSSRADHLVTVGQGPGVYDFVDLQSAIDAAQDGDTILLFPKDYAPATIDGKGLTLLSPKGLALITLGQLTIRNLPADRSVELRDVYFDSEDNAVVVEDCAGTVTLDGCRLFFPAKQGLIARNASRVVLSECDVRGGNPTLPAPFGGGPEPGFPALDLDGSSVHLFDTRCIGGDGADGATLAEATGAGAGVLLRNGSFLSLDGSSVQGGTGGVYGSVFVNCQAVGGAAGIDGDGSSDVHRRDSVVVGGAGTPPPVFPGAPACPGPDGPAFAGVTPFDVPGVERRLFTPAALYETVPAILDFRAEPGDLGLLLIGLAPSPLYTLACGGLALTASQPAVLPLPALDGQGDLELAIAPGPFAPGFEVAQVFLQGVFLDTGGACSLTAPRVPTLLRCVALPGEPDCNGNGLRDLCDVAATVGIDLNGNGVPDECE